MTGNTKVWRAPLAGLASVAMLATMGVAAGTAVAAPTSPKITFSSGANWKFASDDDKDKTGEDPAVLGEGAGVSGSPAADLEIPDGYVFTGWYTSENIGEGVKVDPSAVLKADVTVFPHIVSASTAYKVKYVGNGSGVMGLTAGMVADGTDGDGSNYTTYLASDGSKSDALADWQVPVDNGTVNGKYLGAFTTGNSTEISLTGDAAKNAQKLSDVSNATKGTTNITYTVKDVPAYRVTFHNTAKNDDGTDYTDGAIAFEIVKADGDSVKTDVDIEVPGSAAFSEFAKTPTWKAITSDSQYTASTWYRFDPVNKKVADFDPSKAVTADTDVYVKRTDAAKNHTIRFDYNVASEPVLTYSNAWATDALVADGAQIGGKLPTPTVIYDGGRTAEQTGLQYEFSGWNTKADGSGTAVTSASTFAADTTVYAQWKVVKVLVKFAPNYGDKQVVSTWFSAGDRFTVPSTGAFAREGYTADWAAAPVNALLSIDQDNNELTYEKTTGENKTVTSIAPLSQFKPVWSKNDLTTLTALEDKVAVTDAALKDDKFKVNNAEGNYLNGKTQSKLEGYTAQYTEASFDQYVADFQTYLQHKSEVKDYTDKEYASLISELQDAQKKLVQVGETDVVRLVKDGRHVYSTDENEQKILRNSGWTVEGVAFRASRFQAPYSTAVTRLYNPANGNHLLSTDSNEVKVLKTAGWSVDGTAFYAPQGATTAVNRFHATTANAEHLYTGDINEYNTNLARGYQGDGIVFYAIR
ncbi:hypothetical protein CSQ85_12465 [Bifidobacterium rousetti]|uniref:InlB B-repeat-containing protein n=1 Tax=Bifidobacterium rousetti TaxID=2045439 RepID=UPI0012390E1D|nr:InlB B-repeat-containing protein [Bifidobacterium rousetti]KAA8815635.1 hypothetical protein CSQ85_12465 [Bifidobacterium rousetti]